MTADNQVRWVRRLLLASIAVELAIVGWPVTRCPRCFRWIWWLKFQEHLDAHREDPELDRLITEADPAGDA